MKNRKQVASQASSKDVARSVLIAILAAQLGACEMGVTTFVRPIDHHDESHGFKGKPWICYLKNCPTEKEESGS